MLSIRGRRRSVKPAARSRWHRSTSSHASSDVSKPSIDSKACRVTARLPLPSQLHVASPPRWPAAGRNHAAPTCPSAWRGTGHLLRPRSGRPQVRRAASARIQPGAISWSASTNASSRLRVRRRPRSFAAPTRGRAGDRQHGAPSGRATSGTIRRPVVEPRCPFVRVSTSGDPGRRQTGHARRRSSQARRRRAASIGPGPRTSARTSSRSQIVHSGLMPEGSTLNRRRARECW